MLYNKNQFKKVTNRKILHKVKKHWIAISVAMLGLIGGGTLTATNVSANAASQGNNDNDQRANHSLNTNQMKSQRSTLVSNYYQSGTKQPSSSVATTQTITRRTNHWYRRAVNNGVQSVSQSSSTSKMSTVNPGPVSQSSSTSTSARSNSTTSVNNTESMTDVLKSAASAIDSYNQANKSYANVVLFDLGSLSDSNNNALTYAKNNVAKYYPRFMSFMAKESDVANSLGEQANDPNTSAVSAASDNLSKVSLLNNKAGMVMSKYIEPWEAQSAEAANGSSASDESRSTNNSSSNSSTSNDSSVNSNSVNVSSSASASASVSALNSESVANSIQNSIVVSQYASSVNVSKSVRNSLLNHSRRVRQSIANDAARSTNDNYLASQNTSQLVTNYSSNSNNSNNMPLRNVPSAKSHNMVTVRHSGASVVNQDRVQAKSSNSIANDSDVLRAASNNSGDSNVNNDAENNDVDDGSAMTDSNDQSRNSSAPRNPDEITKPAKLKQQLAADRNFTYKNNRQFGNVNDVNKTSDNRSDNNKLPQTNEAYHGEALAEISLIMSTTLGALSAYIDKHRED